MAILFADKIQALPNGDWVLRALQNLEDRILQPEWTTPIKGAKDIAASFRPANATTPDTFVATLSSSGGMRYLRIGRTIIVQFIFNSFTFTNNNTSDRMFFQLPDGLQVDTTDLGLLVSFNGYGNILDGLNGVGARIYAPPLLTNSTDVFRPGQFAIGRMDLSTITTGTVSTEGTIILESTGS